MGVANAAVLDESSACSDEQVVVDVLNGQTALFEVLMRRHNERAQQAYVNAYAHLRQFKGQAQFSTWLTRIVINEALAGVRHKHAIEPLDEDHITWRRS